MNPSTHLLQALQWRYAVKHFDSTKTIPSADWQTIQSALQLTPSSFGLQPWQFLVVQDKALRASLLPHSWNQPQITDCSHLIVIAAKTQITEAYIDSYMESIASHNKATNTALSNDAFKATIMGYLAGIPQGAFPYYQNHFDYTREQAYIALGNLLTAVALIGIDACPIGGFDPKAYNRILGLNESEWSSVVVCALGYRSSTDPYIKKAKTRFDTSSIFKVL